MSIDLALLADEINTDPTSRGYAPHVTSGATNGGAARLNDILLTITITKRFVVRKLRRGAMRPRAPRSLCEYPSH